MLRDGRDDGFQGPTPMDLGFVLNACGVGWGAKIDISMVVQKMAIPWTLQERSLQGTLKLGGTLPPHPITGVNLPSSHRHSVYRRLRRPRYPRPLSHRVDARETLCHCPPSSREPKIHSPVSQGAACRPRGEVCEASERRAAMT